MLKPIRTVKLKTVGLWLRFARGIMERAASVGSYEMSESELVFAMGAARERDDLMSVLELLDEVLDLIKRGFDRHTNALTIRIINNVGIMLRRGGFSREYSETLEICGRIFAAVEGRTENFSSSECRKEIHKQLALLRTEHTKQTSVGRRASASRFDRAKALRLFGTVSERETFTLNTLNSGMLRIMTRNPELLKMLKSDKAFMELSLKNIGNIRRRTERAVSVQRFLGALTEEQTELLEQFAANEDLFRELREKSSAAPSLKYLLEHSSERSLSEFFGKLEQRVVGQSVTLSERSYFDSSESMREFFVGAQSSEIERLIKELEKDGLYRSEARTLTDALRLYETETEKRRAADLKLTELYRIAETALKRKISAENFSEERFIAALGASHELKRLFADYAWENYRSEETVKRYFAYMRTVSVSEDKFSYSEQTAPRTGTRVISESAKPGTRGVYEVAENPVVGAADNTVNANKDMVHVNGAASNNGAGVAENGAVTVDLADNAVNADKAMVNLNGAVSDNGAGTAENAGTTFGGADAVNSNKAMVYGNSAVSNNGADIAEKRAAAFGWADNNVNADKAMVHINGAVSNNGAGIDEKRTAAFGVADNTTNADKAMVHVNGAASNKDAGIAENIAAAFGWADNTVNVNKDVVHINGAASNNGAGIAENGAGAFGAADNTINSNKDMVHINGAVFNNGADIAQNGAVTVGWADNAVNADKVMVHGNDATFNNDVGIAESAAATVGAYFADGITKESFADFLINSGELGLKFSESVRNSFLNASSDVAAAFAEYLVSTVREDSFAYYSGQVRALAGNVENILYRGNYGIEERSAEIFALIYGAWNENALQLSELYESFTQIHSSRDEILKLYSRLPKNNIAAVSEFLEAVAQGDAYFISLSDDILKQSDKILSGIGGSFGISTNTSEYTFYDALNDMNENALELLMPLVVIRGSSNAFDLSDIDISNISKISQGDTAADESAANGTATDRSSHSNSVYGDFDGNITSADFGGYNTLVEKTSAYVISAAFAEYLSGKVRGDSAAYYNERIHTLAGRLENVLRGEHNDIFTKTSDALALIYGEWNDNSRQLSELYADFTENFTNRGEILRLCSRLNGNAPAHILNIARSAGRGETKLFSFNNDFSRLSERLFEQLSKASKPGFEKFIGETIAGSQATRELYQRLVFAEKASRLRAILPDASNGYERRVYTIKQGESRLADKSIVTDRAFYKALTEFNIASEYDMTDSVSNSILSQLVFFTTAPREYFFTWESGSVTRFNRATADKIYIRASDFFERRSASALTFSERISAKLPDANQHLYTAVELFYTDEYLESGGANTSVNYAFPAAASGNTDDISDRLGNIRGELESINAEVAGIKRREEEFSREFVTKSESKVFEKELKSSIERDIYLAGKRHGIY